MDNSPFAFVGVYEKPLLFEQIRQYMSHVLDVNINHIKLIGSTKTGFRMDVNDYGASYSKVSDLDFMILDESLFSALANEFEIWSRAYHDGVMRPKNEKEKGYWEENTSTTLPRQISLGFIDTKLMPANQGILPINSRVINTMYMVVRNLVKYHGFITKGASMRVYKDVDCYYCQQKRNIDAILNAQRNK